MTESPATPPGVIPYVEHHTGPRRLVTVTLEAPSGLLAGVTVETIAPNLFVDGRQYIVYWGQVTVEVPADRPVHLGVGMHDGMRGASLLLPPGSADEHLHYRVPTMGRSSFGPVAQA